MEYRRHAGRRDLANAAAGSGFGGQLPIAFPDKDVIAVFNAWNILPRGPGLGRGVVVNRVLESIIGN